MSGYYFSIDFESRGKCFSVNGVNAVGIAVFDANGTLLEVYSSGIEALAGQHISEDTAPFWERNAHVLKWIDEHSKTAFVVVSDILALFDKYAARGPVEWIAYPAAYDWDLLHNLVETTFPEALSRIGFKATCISSQLALIADMTNQKKEVLRNNLCPVLDESKAHFPHNDAENQGMLFFKIREMAQLRNKLFEHIK